MATQVRLTQKKTQVIIETASLMCIRLLSRATGRIESLRSSGMILCYPGSAPENIRRRHKLISSNAPPRIAFGRDYPEQRGKKKVGSKCMAIEVYVVLAIRFVLTPSDLGKGG